MHFSLPNDLMPPICHMAACEQGKARFCLAHREPGHVCVRSRKCEHLDGCLQRALYRDLELGVHLCGKHLRYLAVARAYANSSLNNASALHDMHAAVRLVPDRCWHRDCNRCGIYGKPGPELVKGLKAIEKQIGGGGGGGVVVGVGVGGGGDDKELGLDVRGEPARGAKERFCRRHRRPGASLALGDSV